MKIRALEIPDRSIDRIKLEYPTEDVSFAYLSAINKVRYSAYRTFGYLVLTDDSFTNKAVWVAVQVNTSAIIVGRYNNYNSMYFIDTDPGASASDIRLNRVVAGSATGLASEAVDIDTKGRGLVLSCSGSVLKGLRYELLTAVNPVALPSPNGTISATDTSFVSGLFGFRFLREASSHGGSESGSAWLKAPMTPLPPARAIIEVEVEGSGAPEDQYRPALSKGLVEIQSLQGLPEFLYREAKKYQMLISKSFTEDEIKLLLGYIPQHQVDLNSITWGAFEFSEKSPTNILIITGDNPYKSGAIDRQVEMARSKNLKTLRPPRNYGEAVAQFNQLKRDFQHWLAGKDNYAYQVSGLEELDLFQDVDFYFGELVEHKAHYQQLKNVPEWELWRRLEALEEKLSKVTVLTEERDKHMEKLKTIKKLGW